MLTSIEGEICWSSVWAIKYISIYHEEKNGLSESYLLLHVSGEQTKLTGTNISKGWSRPIVHPLDIQRLTTLPGSSGSRRCYLIYWSDHPHE